MELEHEEVKPRLPVPFDSGILYTVVAIYYTYVSKILARFNFNDEINLLLSQLLFLVAPTLILCLIRRYDIKKTLRLKAPKPLEVLLMLVISPVMVITGFCSGFLALFAVKSIFGRVYLSGEVADFMSKGMLISILLVAVTPAICEELLFRGMIQRGIERLGPGWGIFLSGLLFGLFHFDFQRLAAQALIGFIAAYAVYRTGSIVNGMILHFMNNAMLTLLANYAAKSNPGGGTQIVTDPFATAEFIQLAQQYGMTLDQLLGVMAIVLAVILAASVLVIFGLIIVLRAITQNKAEKPEKIKGSAKGLLMGLPGLALIAIVYVSLGLMLVNNGLGKRILTIFGIA
jgi:membrane protease YdiL (CAAX protease family)